MATKKPTRLNLSIYCIKKPDLDDAQILKIDKADRPIDVELGAGAARLFVKSEHVRPPPEWTALFTALPDFPEGVFGRPNSIGAVLLYRGTDGTFLLSFGAGHHLVQDDAVERDFGLRVTLNSVHPNELRSLDKASYSHNPLNSRTQSSKGVDIYDLDVDGETEMLYAVTGASKDLRLGTRVTGRDALNIQVEVVASEIPELLSHILQRYKAKLPAEFEWVDNVSRVRDLEVVEILDLMLDDLLAAEDTSSIWLGEPEIVDWEMVTGYSFDLRVKTGMQTVLSLEKLALYLAAKSEPLNVATLRRQTVHQVDANFTPLKHWTAYRCVHAEVRQENETYVLRNGTWFRVRASFVDQVNTFMKGLTVTDGQLPEFFHDGEGAYNMFVASNDPSYVCMDKRNIRVGGPYDKIEFCDLIKDRTTLIHVKYYRSSSTLSHLFAQGHVAAETFVKDEDFRVRLNQKLPEPCRLQDPKMRPDASAYRVVYAIATNKRLPDDLPFFSKITLKNAARTLGALNYGVELTKIPVNADILKKSFHKPA